jgi:hypothetical protein
MPKNKTLDGQSFPGAFQKAIGTGQARVEGPIAPLFNVDPAAAGTGISSDAYLAAIHPDDRDRVRAVAWRSAKEKVPFLTEYRVTSADGQTRWVLARGQFVSDPADRLLSGSGILIDIDKLQMSEGTFNEVQPHSDEGPLERAADYAIAAQQAIVELQDPELKLHADALLLALGRKLAQQEVQDRRKRMN